MAQKDWQVWRAGLVWMIEYEYRASSQGSAVNIGIGYSFCHVKAGSPVSCTRSRRQTDIAQPCLSIMLEPSPVPSLMHAKEISRLRFRFIGRSILWVRDLLGNSNRSSLGHLRHHSPSKIVRCFTTISKYYYRRRAQIFSVELSSGDSAYANEVFETCRATGFFLITDGR